MLYSGEFRVVQVLGSDVGVYEHQRSVAGIKLLKLIHENSREA